MSRSKIILALILAAFMTGQEVIAQKNNGKNRYSRSKLGYKTPKVKGQKAKIVCPVFEPSGFPYHGIGFKVGDPMGLTYKFYPNKKIAFVIDFGRASSGLYNRYYREKFNAYAREQSDTLSDDALLRYSFHRLRSDWVGELKLLYHIKADKISQGLQVYTGAGWEWKNSHIAYQYDYISTARPPEFRALDRRRTTMGPQVVLGIEYSYFQLPLSAFMEVECFMDVQADPGWKKFEGGVGLRYIF